MRNAETPGYKVGEADSISRDASWVASAYPAAGTAFSLKPIPFEKKKETADSKG
jgi:hypothetical protein